VWQPRHVRQRARGRFRGADYAHHCEQGGHPTPDGQSLLPDHSASLSPARWWFDLAVHGVSVMNYVTAACELHGWAEHVPDAESASAISEAMDRWHEWDGLLAAMAEVQRRRARDRASIFLPDPESER
jgi:hypothetical protein